MPLAQGGAMAEGLLRITISTPDGVRRDEHVSSPSKLGRSANADIRLPFDGVSREHATLLFERGSWWVHDLGSRNGTYVNDERTTAWELRDGDRIRLGAVRIDVVQPPAAFSGALDDKPHQALSQVSVLSRVDSRHLSMFRPAAAQRDHAQLRRDYEFMRAAHALSERMAGLRELGPILESILDFCLEVLPVDVAAVLLRDEQGELVPRYVRTASNSDAEIIVSKTLLAELERTRCALIVSDAQSDERIGGALSVMQSGLRSVLAVPILIGGEFRGAIVADNRVRGSAFRNEELHVLAGIAAQSAVELENLDLVKRVAAETALRTRLSRLLAPELVEQVVDGNLNLDEGARNARIVALYCDIRGFTAMSAKLGPAATMDLLNYHFAGLMETVFQRGGMVHQLTGDELLALWGVVGAQPDDLDRALDCALAIQTRIASDNILRTSQGHPTLLCGIGIETGDAVVGLLGDKSRVQYSVVGSVMNIGARFCSLAEGGQVVARAEPMQPFADRFDLRALPPAMLKGVEGPVDVCTVWRKQE